MCTCICAHTHTRQGNGWGECVFRMPPEALDVAHSTAARNNQENFELARAGSVRVPTEPCRGEDLGLADARPGCHENARHGCDSSVSGWVGTTRLHWSTSRCAESGTGRSRRTVVWTCVCICAYARRYIMLRGLQSGERDETHTHMHTYTHAWSTRTG